MKLSRTGSGPHLNLRRIEKKPLGKSLLSPAFLTAYHTSAIPHTDHIFPITHFTRSHPPIHSMIADTYQGSSFLPKTQIH